MGVPARERKEIFGRFVRGETASRLGIKGTGLGLAMVSYIVQAHGGTIELESEEGVGSTFTIVLPAAPLVPSPSTDEPAMSTAMIGVRQVHHEHVQKRLT
jgi:signal transduction histidine kinase